MHQKGAVYVYSHYANVRSLNSILVNIKMQENIKLKKIKIASMEMEIVFLVTII
jgi:hypothetical protein